ISSVVIEREKEEQVHQCRRDVGVYQPAVTKNSWLECVQDNCENRSNRTEPAACREKEENSQSDGNRYHCGSGPEEDALKVALIDGPEMAVELGSSLREIPLGIRWAVIMREEKDQGHPAPHFCQWWMLRIHPVFGRGETVVSGCNVNYFVAGQTSSLNRQNAARGHQE